MKKESNKIPLKPIVVIALAVIFLTGIIWYATSLVYNAEYFKIKDVFAREMNSTDFSYLLGKNIFSVDLNAQANYIQRFYPDCSKVKILRLLPNRLFVDCVKRRPIAIVKLYRFFAVDENGALFFTEVKPEESDLPLIVGLETKIFGPKPGQKYEVGELTLATTIVKELRKNKVLKNVKVSRIDVSNAQQAMFTIVLPVKTQQSPAPANAPLPTSFDVKIGQDNIKYKIALLSGVLVNAKNELSSIKYVDLRFKDPVIKLNDVKPKQ
jgi:hypothetical protein